MLAAKVRTILIEPAFWGLLSLLLTVAAYAWYLFDTFKKGVRPHILTWIAFGGFTAVGWLVQVKQGAGPGDQLLTKIANYRGYQNLSGESGPSEKQS
jgi:hypothetical protein